MDRNRLAFDMEVSPNEDMVREHAMQGGFPANRISRVMQVIDPTTAE